jgi:protein-tyrosine phosphatase
MLPAPRTPGRYRIALVCLGNICRSPMADVVLSAKLEKAGLGDEVEVGSCGTAGWHVGKRMDERAAATLTAAGYDPTRHRARQYDPGWHATYDLVLAMDDDNRTDVLTTSRLDTDGADRVRKFRDFDPVETGADVPDPYYGGPAGFEEVLSMVERTSTAIVTALQRERSPR